MKTMRLSLSSLLSGALVFGSLGISGFVGTVTALADDQTAVQRPTNAIDALDAGQFTETTNSPVSVIKVSKSAGSQVLGARLSKDGMLSGRLNVSDSISGAHVPAENLGVRFIQRGSVISQAKPGPGGVFQVDGLAPGVYSMIASGPDGLYASALVIYPYENPEVTAGSSPAQPLQIDATVVHPSNVELVTKLIMKAAGTQPMPSTSPAPARRHISQVALRNEADMAPAPLQTPVLSMAADGQVSIRINDVDGVTGERTLAVGSSIYLIQRGAVRSKSTVDANGTFNARGTAPGQYSLLALSPNGKSFAAIGVIVETAAPNAGTVQKSGRLVVQQVKAASRQQGSSVDMMPTSDFNPPADPNAPQQQVVDGGGTGGVGRGGGAGGGGGGGLGGLAALAGLAGLAGLSNNSASGK